MLYTSIYFDRFFIVSPAFFFSSSSPVGFVVRAAPAAAAKKFSFKNVLYRFGHIIILVESYIPRHKWPCIVYIFPFSFFLSFCLILHRSMLALRYARPVRQVLRRIFTQSINWQKPAVIGSPSQPFTVFVFVWFCNDKKNT